MANQIEIDDQQNSIRQVDCDAASWGRVKEKMRQTYGDAVFRSWLKPLKYKSVEGRSVFIEVPTRFVKDWVSNNYLATMLRLWQSEDPSILEICLNVIKTETSTNKTGEARQGSHEKANHNIYHKVSECSDSKAPFCPIDTSNISAALDPRYTFDNFVVGKPNDLAFAAAKRVAESDNVVPGCNPLFLYGGVGLGKTHLMHAIAWHIRRTNPERRVVYLSAEKFMHQFVRALRFNDTIAFKEQFRSVDVLMVDDVQFISGKDSTQEEFFHTFNSLVEQNKQLVISADRSPSDLEGLEERVRSRLGWGLVADINATSYELRLGILQLKAEKIKDIKMPREVLEFLAQKITSNVRELEGALNRVVANASLVGNEITVDHTRMLLKDLLRSCDRKITVEDIQKRVATHYNIKVSDMHSGRRSVSIARPRQVAMYLSKQLTHKSLPEIGRKFGGKDHTTVMHAVKRIEEIKIADHEIMEDIELLSRQLQS